MAVVKWGGLHKRAIFLDKDGTLVENVPYNVDPSRVTLTRGAEEGLSLLARDFEFHVVTNQAGVALGRFREEELLRVRDKIHELLGSFGTKLAGFHYCPHAPNEGCSCRKPGSLLFHKASREYGIDLSRSWMIGDILDDVEAGKRAGCRTIFLDVGNETEWVQSEWRRPDFKARDLCEAALLISEQERKVV